MGNGIGLDQSQSESNYLVYFEGDDGNNGVFYLDTALLLMLA